MLILDAQHNSRLLQHRPNLIRSFVDAVLGLLFSGGVLQASGVLEATTILGVP